MDDGGPYRALPKFLMCPRCGELLERAFDDVLACMRCEGIWITPPTVALAFGDPAWPTGTTTLWWRNELECPECAHAGQTTMMAAQLATGIQIDRCKDHGLWLDRGELGRLVGGSGHELDELRSRLRGDEPDLDKLAAKREAWRRDIEARRKAAEEYNAWLATERDRQIANAEARARGETQALHRATRPVEERPPVRDDDPAERPRPVREADPAELVERERERAERRETLMDARSTLVEAIDTFEDRISRLRGELHLAEADLAGARIKMRGLNEQIAKIDG